MKTLIKLISSILLTSYSVSVLAENQSATKAATAMGAKAARVGAGAVIGGKLGKLLLVGQ